MLRVFFDVLTKKVDARRDQVRVDGDRVSMRPQSEVKWVAINKPKGVICTLSDELGRPTAVDVVPRGRELRLVPVGRLDRDSCGLLLMTNENSWVSSIHFSVRFSKARWDIQSLLVELPLLVSCALFVRYFVCISKWYDFK